MPTNKRIIMAKMGLDAHDNGLRIVSKWLADAGYEVIYAGVYNSAERILRMVIEENADAVGISFLGGEHLHYSRKLLDLFRENDLKGVKLIAGGIIPPCGCDRHERPRRGCRFYPRDAAERDSKACRRVPLSEYEGALMRVEQRLIDWISTVRLEDFPEQVLGDDKEPAPHHSGDDRCRRNRGRLP